MFSSSLQNFRPNRCYERQNFCLQIISALYLCDLNPCDWYCTWTHHLNTKLRLVTPFDLCTSYKCFAILEMANTTNSRSDMQHCTHITKINGQLQTYKFSSIGLMQFNLKLIVIEMPLLWFMMLRAVFYSGVVVWFIIRSEGIISLWSFINGYEYS